MLVLVAAALGCAAHAPPRTARPPEAPSPPVEAEEPEGGYTNTLRWKTASEVDNFGFDVYRSESEDGPFERLTERPVQGAGTSDVPSEYSWVDTAIDPRRAYYYYVESISMSGERERFTPVIRAKPKLEADAR